MKNLPFALNILIFIFAGTTCTTPIEKPKPNVLLIAVDDLNDWIACLGGHPQAKTPNIDRLAANGVLFTNAHCQAPVCNPSRASMMASLYPSTSGIYFLNPDIKDSPIAKRNTLMPQRFQDEGYHVSGAGKLFHNGHGINERYIPNYAGQMGGFGPMPNEKISPYPGHPLWDWGVFPERDDQMPDYKVAQWAVERLSEHRDSAIWMGVGFYRPHVPQFAPQKWFDMYPIDSIQLPVHIKNDLDDISQYGKDITRLEHVHPPWEWVIENDQWKPLVQSYLACVSFVDEQIGKVYKALENSEYAANTFVVLYSDHGFHQGEKGRFAKRSLWEDGARVPMIIFGPGIPKGVRCNKPVQLLDIYPTLLDLCGLEADSLHEGNSLVPLLKEAESGWPYYARTSFGPGNYAIVSEGFRFIQYNGGSEEFYDHANDPHEWYNVVDNPKYANLIEEHRAQIPQKHHPILGEKSTGHLSFAATEAKQKK
ncbi:sulfatase [uncultured Draconibacterium sp.]|uniref:sulfatase n=1 Tax=uncultured Draconibacterium sp. TaxID=1573823 RepID=UPI003261A0A2